MATNHLVSTNGSKVSRKNIVIISREEKRMAAVGKLKNMSKDKNGFLISTIKTVAVVGFL